MVVGAVGAVVVARRLLDGGPAMGARQDPAPALVAGPDPARGSVHLAVSGGVVPGPVLEVMIEPPAGATEMQVGLDPTFATTAWVPVGSAVDVFATDVGHTMVFGRFRAGPGSEPSPVSVDHVTVDPTVAAATASATGPHRASWARPVTRRLVEVRIEAGRLVPGAQLNYDLAAPAAGDEVSRGLLGPRVVSRQGEPWARQVGDRDDLVKVFDRIDGRPFDIDGATSGPWRVVSDDDPGLGAQGEAEVVTWSSRPRGSGFGPDDDRLIPLVHDIVVELPVPLVDGASYELTAPGGGLEPVVIRFDPASTVSAAVHVNQAGYGVDDPLKVAYVSSPLGVGDVHQAGTRFQVVESTTLAVVHEGVLTGRPGGDELDQGDLTGTAVLEADFSPVAVAGTYRVCVDDVGCSVDVEVRPDAWWRLTVAVARSMYHQRSGAALGPPHSAVGRPRPYHPDDGMVIETTDLRLLDTFDMEGGEVFTQLVERRTGGEVAEAWGGHFDAGDWDRRIQHLYYVRAVADLVARRPEVFGSLDLGLPESGDAVPDLLDEGLWTLDFFARLQTDDGGIRGGVEASEHPQPATTSWTDELAVFAYSPDPWSSYVYAGVAAEVALVLDGYDPVRADGYASSALRAMTWAEDQPAEPRFADLIAAQRSVAAVALYRLTDDRHWHDVFLEATTLDDGVDRYLSCHAHDRCDAAWSYLALPPDRADPALRAQIEASFVATADEIVAAADDTAFGWAVENRFAPLIWGLGVGGSPSSTGLLRAWELTGDERYRAAALRSAAVTLGANPIDTVYLTGIGREPVGHPLIVDVMNGGLPVWAGTPVYGNHQISPSTESWVDEFVLGPAGVAPRSEEVPYLWQWFDVSHVAMFNEYTVFQSHAEALYAFGLLTTERPAPAG